MSTELPRRDRDLENAEVASLRARLQAQARELRFSRMIQAESRRESEISREELVETRRHRDEILGELAVARAQLDAATRELAQIGRDVPTDPAELDRLRQVAVAAEARRAEIEAWTPVRVAFRAQGYLLRHQTMRRAALRVGRMLAPRG